MTTSIESLTSPPPPALTPPTTPPNPIHSTTTNKPSDPPSSNPTTTFLTSPSPPTCTSTIIDFSRTAIADRHSSFAQQIHHLLTPSECAHLLTLAQSTTTPPSTWLPAEVNVGQGKQRLILDARNCGRIIWDDATIAERLMGRILPHLPREIVTLKGRAGITGWGPVRRNEVWRISRLNERLRFLKYTRGMYFREHCDGSYVTPDGREVSFLTVHIYLNGGAGGGGDGTEKGTKGEFTNASAENGVVKAGNEGPAKGGEGEGEGLIGGSTRFFSDSCAPDRYLDVNPEVGACLVFQHRGLLHSGEEVERGVKYTVRSDVMYEKVEAGEGV